SERLHSRLLRAPASVNPHLAGTLRKRREFVILESEVAEFPATLRHGSKIYAHPWRLGHNRDGFVLGVGNRDGQGWHPWNQQPRSTIGLIDDFHFQGMQKHALMLAQPVTGRILCGDAAQ